MHSLASMISLKVSLQPKMIKPKERSDFCVTVIKKKIYFPRHVTKEAHGSASCWQPPCYLEEVNKASQPRRQRQEDLNKGSQSLGDNMTFVVKPHWKPFLDF